jgi:hypothetical protein
MAKPLHRGTRLGFRVGVDSRRGRNVERIENGQFARCPVCFGWHKFGIRIVAEKVSGKLSCLPCFVRDYDLFRFLVSVGFSQGVFVAYQRAKAFRCPHGARNAS